MRLDKAGTAVSPPHSEPLCLAKLIASWLQTIISQQISGWRSLRLPRRTRHPEEGAPASSSVRRDVVVRRVHDARGSAGLPATMATPDASKIRPKAKFRSLRVGEFSTPRLHVRSHPWPRFRRGRHRSIKAASKKKKKAKGTFPK